MKNKSICKREIHVKNTLRVGEEGFVETKRQKRQRKGKPHRGSWYGVVYI